MTGNAYLCLDDRDRIAAEIGPGENMTGRLTLDVAAESGVLVYKPWFLWNAGGWEWEF